MDHRRAGHVAGERVSSPSMSINDSAPVPAAERNRDERFAILAVCTGNICRSPAVELMLRHALQDHPSVSVASAGTGALVGHGVAEPMARLLDVRNVDPTGFAARQLTPRDSVAADLVIGLAREHRSAVVAESPRALRRTFTLLEFARLTADVDPAMVDETATGSTPASRLRALVPLARARRGSRAYDPRYDDVVDPWRKSDATYRESLRQISEALDVITSAITR